MKRMRDRQKKVYFELIWKLRARGGGWGWAIVKRGRCARARASDSSGGGGGAATARARRRACAPRKRRVNGARVEAQANGDARVDVGRRDACDDEARPRVRHGDVHRVVGVVEERLRKDERGSARFAHGRSPARRGLAWRAVHHSRVGLVDSEHRRRAVGKGVGAHGRDAKIGGHGKGGGAREHRVARRNVLRPRHGHDHPQRL